MAQLLRQMPPEDTRRDGFLGHPCTAAGSLSELVSNVLDLSKDRAGALLSRTPVRPANSSQDL